MTETIKTLIEPIQERLNAATLGPWTLQECSPCTERGRLDVIVWADNGNIPVTGWHDSDPYEAGDAVLIANAPTDQARLLAAVQAVMGVCEEYDAVAEASSAVPGTKSFQSNRIRAAIESALTEAR